MFLLQSVTTKQKHEPLFVSEDLQALKEEAYRHSGKYLLRWRDIGDGDIYAFCHREEEDDITYTISPIRSV